MNGSEEKQSIDNMLTTCACLPGATSSKDAMKGGSGAYQGTMDKKSERSQETCSSTGRWLQDQHVREAAPANGQVQPD